VEKSFEAVLQMAGIKEFRFHDLRHTFASWYMMNGGDLYELAKILGHSNIKMTEGYAKLAKNPHCQDWKHGPRDVETDDWRNGEQGRSGFVNVSVLFP
jgi:integrase